MADRYGKLSVQQLKLELSKRNASTIGRKEDLVQRLEAYDLNDDFRGPVINLPEEIALPNWPSTGFKTVTEAHSEVLPLILSEQITAYFKYRQAVDAQAASDIKALERGQLMLDSMTIQALSVCIGDDCFYFSGCVKAAMKKKVQYNYKLVICKSGEIKNTECECPAGKGPHSTCKHVATVIFCIQKLVQEKTLNVEQSCTEILQTFHKPKGRFVGSPMKIEDFRKRKLRIELNVSEDDDPRPLKFRKMEGFNDQVRNAVLNFSVNTGMDIALRYCYSKANVQAAAVDHDYFDVPFTEMVIDRGNNITVMRAVKLERDTVGQSNNKKWFSAREWRVTASNFGTICKRTCRRNIKKLCESVRGVKNNLQWLRPIVHGKTYESVAIRKFQERFRKVVLPCGLFVHETYNFLGASPDGLIGDDTIIEVKCPYSGRNEKIAPGKHFPFLKTGINNVVSLKVDHNYYFQIQGQLLISKRKFCYFVVYTFKDFFVQRISVDENYCEGSMVPKLELFYKKHYRSYLASLL